MVDTIDKKKRSWVMSRIRSTNTKPEKIVRSMIHRMGFRFRLHRKDLPGNPDIVLPKLKTVVFVHGCFWHCHSGCKKNRLPKSNTAFWTEKFQRNVTRDKENYQKLEEQGWKYAVVWECETEKPEVLEKKLKSVLSMKTRYQRPDPQEIPQAAEEREPYHVSPPEKRGTGKKNSHSSTKTGLH